MDQLPLNIPKKLPKRHLPSPLSWSQQPVSLPSSPGVYWYTDVDKNILYVGKAKNLKNRLNSYRRLNQLLPKTKQMVEKIHQTHYQVLSSELEALLIEAELIRIHQPSYNILLKDDKSPLYIITTKEPYPKVLAVRRSDLKKYNTRKTFGPFPSSKQVKSVLKIIRKIFPYCNQSRKLHKPCFYYHINLCPGACTETITTKEYQSIIKHIELFLSGKSLKIIQQIRRQINTASNLQNYELAHFLKQKIDAITYVHTYYKNKINEHQLPQLSDDIGITRIAALNQLLKNHGIIVPQNNRIEVYDVANIQGQSAAVSMVVAINGKVEAKHYRHFSIKSLSTPNDAAMLVEALNRRSNHSEWGTANLIVLDGGKPQVAAAQKTTHFACPIIGLAKKPDRLIILKSDKTTDSILLDPHNPGSQLLIQLRDEAHRFSRKLHHKLSTKKLLES